MKKILFSILASFSILAHADIDSFDVPSDGKTPQTVQYITNVVVVDEASQKTTSNNKKESKSDSYQYEAIKSQMGDI